jgi:hypothetical protein
VELEAAHPGASDEMAGSRSAGVVEIELDAGDDRDSTPPTVASRRATGNGKRCVRLSRRCRYSVNKDHGWRRAAASSTTSGSRPDDSSVSVFPWLERCRELSGRESGSFVLGRVGRSGGLGGIY